MRHQNIRVTMEMYAQALKDQKRAAHEKVVGMIVPTQKGSRLFPAPAWEHLEH
jgi:hypothetical protein